MAVAADVRACVLTMKAFLLRVDVWSLASLDLALTMEIS